MGGLKWEGDHWERNKCLMLSMEKGWLCVLLYSGEKRLLRHQNIMHVLGKKVGEKNDTETSKLLYEENILLPPFSNRKEITNLAVNKHEGWCELTCEAILMRTSSSTQFPVTALYLQNQTCLLEKCRGNPNPPISSTYPSLSLADC